jgi:hypothetical protein
MTMNSFQASLDYHNVRLATKAESTDAFSFDLDGQKLLVMTLAPMAGPVRAPCAALDAIALELELPKKKNHRRVSF